MSELGEQQLLHRETDGSDPGSETTMRPATRPAQARLIIAADPICS